MVRSPILPVPIQLRVDERGIPLGPLRLDDMANLDLSWAVCHASVILNAKRVLPRTLRSGL